MVGCGVVLGVGTVAGCGVGRRSASSSDFFVAFFGEGEGVGDFVGRFFFEVCAADLCVLAL